MGFGQGTVEGLVSRGGIVQVVRSSSRWAKVTKIWKYGSAVDGCAVAVCRAMKDCRDCGLRDQITRSAVSVPSNIAEGAERNTQPEFIQFLGYAKGSLAELRTQLLIARDLEYLPSISGTAMLNEAEQLSRMVYRLAQSQKPSTA